MIYVKKVLITTYILSDRNSRLGVSVEFHRSDGSFREFESVSSNQLKRLFGALKGSTHPNCTGVDVERDQIISWIEV